MKRSVLFASVLLCAFAGAAAAADLPSRRAPVAEYVPPPPTFTWTGAYVGLDIGYAWQTARPSYYGFIPGPHLSPSGVVGGAYLGYNYQFNQNIIVGIEGDVEGAGVSATDISGGKVGNNIRGSVRGRLGYAFDRALFYATGGVTIGDVSYTPGIFFFPWGNATSSTTRAGWNLGGGMEFAFTKNWIGRVEYRYTDFGTANVAPFGPGAAVRVKDNALRAGVSYKFDFGSTPIMNRY
jgi:outer membrane immunogenic protein